MRLSSITLRNYRTFGASGVRVPLDHEFLAIVGVNNSGKSSLLRAFHELRGVFSQLASWEAGHGHLHSFLESGHPWPIQLQAGERIVPAHDENLEPRIDLDYSPDEDDLSPSVTRLTIIVTPSRGLIRGALSLSNGVVLDGSNSKVSSLLRGAGNAAVLQLQSGTNTFHVDWASMQPSLRSLQQTMYVGPFRNAINTGGANYYDISVGKNFIEQFDQYKTGDDHRANRAVVDLMEHLAAIFGVNSLDVSATPGKDRLVFRIDGESFRGTELGAGLTQFVIVAANVLVMRPTLLLIDEPELNLHAALQLRFLTLLARYSSRVIFATHSLGLARSGADQVLVATRDGFWTSLQDYAAVPSLSSVLGEMGYGGLNDTPFKAVLLVEGPTEVRTFQQLLGKYDVRTEVVIVPLGGDGLASGRRDQELGELRRLSERVFAIVDSEREASDAPLPLRREQFKQSCDALGIGCHVLSRRSMENYLDQNIARRVQRCPAAPPFTEFEKPDISWSWDKERNWRIAMEMPRSLLSGTDLEDALLTISRAVHRE